MEKIIVYVIAYTVTANGRSAGGTNNSATGKAGKQATGPHIQAMSRELTIKHVPPFSIIYLICFILQYKKSYMVACCFLV